MSERVLPGVSIKELTEGLIAPGTPGAVAVKLVGTACKGPTDPQKFGPDELGRLKTVYGPPDPFRASEGTASGTPSAELTLVRAAELLYGAGAPPGGVWVCRASDGTNYATGEIIATTTTQAITMSANFTGAWYNNFQYKHLIGENAEGVSKTDANVLCLKVPSYDYVDTVASNTNGTRTSVNRWYDSLTPEVKWEYHSQTATSAPIVSDFLSGWNASPFVNWFTPTVGTATNGMTFSEQTSYVDLITNGSDNWGSGDTGSVTTTTLSNALEQLRSKEARITLVAGGTEEVTGTVALGQGHVNNCSREKIEQLFFAGTEINANQNTFVTNAETYSLVDERVVMVAPGVKVANRYKGKSVDATSSTASPPWEITGVYNDIYETLSGGYAAATVAGITANKVPDESPMNKPLSGVSGLEHDFTLSNKKRLVRADYFLLVKDNGHRTLRDLSRAGAGEPFYHVSTRMAIDDIKRSIRLTGQPFIGRKNTARVLGKLKRNLEYTLNEYVRREIINPTFSLTVTSERDEQILGVVRVVMTIQPVFYIEFIEVELILE